MLYYEILHYQMISLTWILVVFAFMKKTRIVILAGNTACVLLVITVTLWGFMLAYHI